MAIRKELLDELMASCEGSEDLLGPDGLLKQLKGALVERMLQEEMTATWATRRAHRTAAEARTSAMARARRR
jgi:transposase-like protein